MEPLASIRLNIKKSKSVIANGLACPPGNLFNAVIISTLFFQFLISLSLISASNFLHLMFGYRLIISVTGNVLPEEIKRLSVRNRFTFFHTVNWLATVNLAVNSDLPFKIIFFHQHTI